MRLLVLFALFGCASGFSMCLNGDVSRRQALQTGAGVAAAAPFIPTLPASAKRTPKPPKPPAVIHPWQTSTAPFLYLFDHVGCSRTNTEYKGAMSNTPDDERCVMVEVKKIPEWDLGALEAFNRDRVATYASKYQDLVITGYNGQYPPRKVGQGLIHPPDSDYCKAGGTDCAR